MIPSAGGATHGHTYTHNPVHVVFSTKDRGKLIPKESQARLWAYLGGVCKKQKIFAHEIGGMEEHLHMLIQIPLTLSFSDAMQEVKTSSSRWMGRNFAWQRGFGVLGVSAFNVDSVVRYIRTQEAHHRKMTFEQEFIALLERNTVLHTISDTYLVEDPVPRLRRSPFFPSAYPRRCRGLPCGRA